MTDDLPRLRVDYRDAEFTPEEAGVDPMATFAAWFDDAVSAGAREPNAMALATVAADGTPSVRMVLLKHVDPSLGAFTWFTNLDSRKSAELRTSGRAALCWWWPAAGAAPARQIRAVGRVHEVGREQSRLYFAGRPRAAQVGAAASPQSRVLASRQQLEARASAIGLGTVDLPERWGGWQLVADELELWQGRGGRLHDRITFLRLDAEGRPHSPAGVESAGGLDSIRAMGVVVEDSHGSRWLRARLAP